VRDAAPGRVLRLAIVGWGLGDLALGRRAAGVAWLLAEAMGLAAAAASTLLWADSTWHLLPFLLGAGFLVAWAFQAVVAYRRAQRGLGAEPANSGGSAAAAIAWLTIPLLAWGTGFWLVAADAASPAAVLDRFVTAWPSAEPGGEIAWAETLAEEPAILAASAADAMSALRDLCAEGAMAEDCGDAAENLLRDVRVRIVASSPAAAVAVADLVRYEGRPSRFLGLFDTTEIEPVRITTVLRIILEARPAALGAERWTIVNAVPG
jgi:hypothetical protein